jgi:hypothetical protein
LQKKRRHDGWRIHVRLSGVIRQKGMVAFFLYAPVNQQVPAAEAETVHIHIRRIHKVCDDGPQRDASHPFMRIKIVPGTDAGERSAAKAIVPGKLQ